MIGRSIARLCAIAFLVAVFPQNAGAAHPRHLRLTTDHGPIHVWYPANYAPETAGIVVYVHGYFTDVDQAWRAHHLAKQFAESGLNAMFIACEAPDGPRDSIKWTSLGDLLDAVATGIGDELPAGRVAVVGHSGAHRTLSLWVEEDRVDTVVLVDALYGDMPQFRTWLDADPSHRLIDAAVLTREWTDALHAAIPETLVFDRFPPAGAGRLLGARRARVVYVRSQHDHMSLITGGVALPMLLRALTVPVVESASRDAPIHAIQ